MYREAENESVKKCIAGTGSVWRIPRRHLAVLALVITLQLFELRARAQNHVDYRYESYKEADGRIAIETHSALLEVKAAPWASVKADFVYDAISGATPTGAPAPSQLKVIDVFTGQPYAGHLSSKVPLTSIVDTRYAGSIEPTFSFGQQRLTPGFAYSEEGDYISAGGSLNYAIDLNEKNTTLNFGWSHNADLVLVVGSGEWEHKTVDDFIIGLNQLLGPKTVLTANVTYGNADGYLADPYKGVYFEGYPVFVDPTHPSRIGIPLTEEKRPGHRSKYIGYVSLTQAVDPLKASVEGSYRLYHDSFGVDAHTLGLTWFQKIGRHVVVSPLFRFTHQSAADFYGVQFPGLPTDADAPHYYSADYRLSEMNTYAFGVAITGRVTDWLSLDVGYKRYNTFGADGVTDSSAYPKANIFTVGARVWF